MFGAQNSTQCNSTQYGSLGAGGDDPLVYIHAGSVFWKSLRNWALPRARVHLLERAHMYIHIHIHVHVYVKDFMCIYICIYLPTTYLSIYLSIYLSLSLSLSPWGVGSCWRLRVAKLGTSSEFPEVQQPKSLSVSKYNSGWVQITLRSQKPWPQLLK